MADSDVRTGPTVSMSTEVPVREPGQHTQMASRDRPVFVSGHREYGEGEGRGSDIVGLARGCLGQERALGRNSHAEEVAQAIVANGAVLELRLAALADALVRPAPDAFGQVSERTGLVGSSECSDSS